MKKRSLKRQKKPTRKMDRGKASKTPRLCPEHRFQSRFYEPLVLLHVLDRNGERQILHTPRDSALVLIDARELRRSFFDQLAYVCDYIKGGDTVTAVALEAQPSGTIFWVASNNSPSRLTLLFLQGVLKTLQSIALSPPGDSRSIIEDEIAQRCITFNLKRLYQYHKLMERPLRECLANLRGLNELEGKRFIDLLLDILWSVLQMEF